MMFQAKTKLDLAGKAISPESINLLLSLFLEEVFATATEEQAGLFLSSVGRRLAGLVPLKNVRRVEDIQETLNQVWKELDWGYVVLTLDDGGIDIVHKSIPVSRIEPGAIAWEVVMPFLLQGAYAAWLYELSGNADIRTWVLASSASQIDLRHAL